MNFLSNSNKKYFINISWLAIEKGFRVLESFIIGIWLARYFGPKNLGIFSYSQSFVYLFSAIAGLGLDQIVVKRLVNFSEKKNEILGTAFILKLLGFLLMFFLLWISLNLVSNDEYTNEIVLIIGGSVFFKSFNGIDFYFQSNVRSRYIVYVNVFVIVLAGIIKVIFILNNFPLIYFAYIILLEGFLTAIGYIFYYHYLRFSIYLWKFKFKTAKELLSKSWPLIIGSIAASIYMKIDQVMIKELLGKEATGIYEVAVKLCNVWLFITIIITQSVFPKLVSLNKVNQKMYLMRLQQLYDLLLKIAILAALLYTFLSDYFILILFGEEYIESSKILVIYSWSILFVFLSNASWGFYLNKKLEKFSSVRLVIGAVINIILNLLFINRYGTLGAAYATLISYFISGYLVNLFFKKTRPNFWLQTKSFINFLNYRTWIKPLG